MNDFYNLSKKVKNKFIKLSLKLEPKKLYKDDKKDHMRAQAKANSIFLKWVKLEKKHNVIVPLEDIKTIYCPNL